MHEFFLCAAVPTAHRDHILRIVQGYCGHQPRHRWQRALLFHKHPSTPRNGFAPVPAAQLPNGARVPFKQLLYGELSEVLKKSAYGLQLLYDVAPHEFAPDPTQPAPPAAGEQKKELDDRQGTLIWRDIPDAPGGRPVNSRRIVLIRDEEKLLTGLKANLFQFRNECIYEGYQAVRDDVEFLLFRILQYPAPPLGAAKPAQPVMPVTLPAISELTPFDQEDKWVLFASVIVLDPTDPRQSKQAMEELVTVKTQLSPEIDLQLVDRRLLDTRTPQF